MEKRSFYVSDRIDFMKTNHREIDLNKFELLANFAVTLEEKEPKSIGIFGTEMCGHMTALIETLYNKKKVEPVIAFYKKLMDDIYPYPDARELLNTLILMKPIIEKFKMEGIGDLRLVEKFNKLSEKYNELIKENQIKRDQNCPSNREPK